MRSLVCVLIWTICFISFGSYTNNEVNKFTNKYEDNIVVIESLIEDNNWNKAKEELTSYSENYHKEKDIWYKLLDHTYFDDICLYMNILDKAILDKNKIKSFEEIEKIKITLSNILESGAFDMNHIF